MITVDVYRLTSDEMASAARKIGCRFLVPHTTRGYRWTREGEPAVMVTNNSTDSRWWQYLATQSPAICLIRGRLRWKSTLQGQTAFYFGPDPGSFAAEFGRFGGIIRNAAAPMRATGVKSA